LGPQRGRILGHRTGITVRSQDDYLVELDSQETRKNSSTTLFLRRKRWMREIWDRTAGKDSKSSDRKVEALQGGRGQEAFYSTCYQATAEQVIAWYASRWSIEVSFHDSKQHLGFEEPQGWSRKAVERTAPLAMLLYSLIVLWFAREGHQFYQPLNCPWYTTKAESSFADMLTTLRRRSMRQKVLSLALRGPGSRKIKLLLENVVALAT